MGFFEEVDSTGIVEDHINDVLKLEHNEARSMLTGYNEIRKDLIDKLSRARAGTFTQQHLRGVLAQVEGAIIALNSSLNGAAKESSYKAALKGVDGLLHQMSKFDDKFTGAVTPINLNAASVALDTSNLLVTRYKTNLDAYGTGLYQQISNGLFSAVTGEASYDEVVGKISRFFTGKEWELHRIIRTELHNVVNIGKLDGMSELVDGEIPDLMKTLMHPMDSRTGKDSMYAARLGLVADIDEPFKYKWNSEWRIFMAPPDRPNDRSILVPYRREWGNDKGAAFIPGDFSAA